MINRPGSRRSSIEYTSGNEAINMAARVAPRSGEVPSHTPEKRMLSPQHSLLSDRERRKDGKFNFIKLDEIESCSSQSGVANSC